MARTVTWLERMKIWEGWYKRQWESIGPVATLAAVRARLDSFSTFVALRGSKQPSPARPGGTLRAPAKSCYLDLSCHRKLARRIQEAAWRDPVHGEEARASGPTGGADLAKKGWGNRM